MEWPVETGMNALTQLTTRMNPGPWDNEGSLVFSLHQLKEVLPRMEPGTGVVIGFVLLLIILGLPLLHDPSDS